MRKRTTRGGPARRKREARFIIKNWVNRLPDVPAFIIGNAPSIFDDEIELTLLDKYFTIGTNRAFYKIDPTVLLWQDVSLWNTEFHSIHNLQALKVCRDIADPRRIYYNYYLKGSEYMFEKQAHILYGRGSTGPLAVEFAHALGCNPIVCVGMDCKKGKDGRTDFYGDNPHWVPHTLPNCIKGLHALAELCPVKIINCSKTETLGPQLSLEEGIKASDPKGEFALGRKSYVNQLLKGVSN